VDYSMLLCEQFGMLLPDELRLLKRTVRAYDEETPLVIDIGTGAGITAIAVLEEKPRARVTSIDIIPSSTPSRVEEAGFRTDIITFVTCDSTEAGNSWEGPVDIIILDGDASPAKVSEDLRAWCKHLRVGGMLLVHDYGDEVPMWEHKKDAVDRFVKDSRLRFVERVGCLAIFTLGAETVEAPKRRGRPPRV